MKAAKIHLKLFINIAANITLFIIYAFLFGLEKLCLGLFPPNEARLLASFRFILLPQLNWRWGSTVNLCQALWTDLHAEDNGTNITGRY